MTDYRRRPHRAWMIARSVMCAALLTLVVACAGPELPESTLDSEGSTSLAVQDPDTSKYYASDELQRLGVEHFNRGSYGLAARYFQDAVDKAPNDVAAWIGLAGSYDRIARFDLADRAYAEAIRLGGETSQVLNNVGYSYLLRGDFPKARAKFMKASTLDPRNPTIRNNINLLNGSKRFIQRSE